MAVAAILDLKGKQVGDLPLSDEIFATGNEASVSTMHAALLRQLSNTRTGSANTKTRAEVRGGGAKPWRQKGTGRARAGSRRSPLWAGGGITFGPKPRDYSFAMPAKMRKNAIKSALAVQTSNLIVVESFAALKEIKTKAASKVLQDLKLNDKKVLIVLEPQGEEAKRFGLSVRNLKNVIVVRSDNLGVKELLDCEAILTSQAAIEAITKWLAPAKEVRVAKPKRSENKKQIDKEEAKVKNVSGHKKVSEHKEESAKKNQLKKKNFQP